MRGVTSAGLANAHLIQVYKNRAERITGIRGLRSKNPYLLRRGTVTKDISSEDLADRVRERRIMSHAPQNRKELLADLARRVTPGGAVIPMGARDPTLSLLAQEIKNIL
jgi:hypothetical protein